MIEGPWFTEYLEVLQEDDADIGLGKCDFSKYPNLEKRKCNLVALFNAVYWGREIGAETVYRWQKMVENRFNLVAPKYDIAYEMYDKYLEETKNRIGVGNETDNKATFYDTPSNIIEDLNKHATNVNISSIITKTNDRNFLEYVNKYIDQFKTLDVQFVDEFEIDFMGVYARV